MVEAIERFMSQVETGEGEDDCWYWMGYRNERNYGQFYDKGKTWKSHRWAYTFFRGEIEPGLELDHLCHNEACCNPWHTEAVTKEVNLQRRDRWQAFIRKNLQGNYGGRRDSRGVWAFQR